MIYLVIGDGKLAKHSCEYFKLLDIKYYSWHYRNHENSNISTDQYIAQILKNNNLKHSDNNNIRIFIALKDNVVEDFIIKNINIKLYKSIFHFSGSLITKLAIGIHPLMTFSHKLYDLKTYKSIPFVSCSKHNINNLLPDLPNTIHKIPEDYLNYYHALCVMTGNFTQILWDKTSSEMENKLELPKDIINLYIKNITNNYIQSPTLCLTGPLSRNDTTTIDNNLKSLKENNNSLNKIYLDFCNLYHENKKT